MLGFLFGLAIGMGIVYLAIQCMNYMLHRSFTKGYFWRKGSLSDFKKLFNNIDWSFSDSDGDRLRCVKGYSLLTTETFNFNGERMLLGPWSYLVAKKMVKSKIKALGKLRELERRW